MMPCQKRKTLLLLQMVTLLSIIERRRQKRNLRRWWIKPWLNRTGNLEIANDFLNSNDLESFKNYLRMDQPTFEKLLGKIKHRIQKNDTILRESFSAKNKLIITLRYLATGETYKSSMYNNRISDTTIGQFVPIVCKAIYDELKNDYLKAPSTAAEWLEISQQFEEKWNLPNILGALDGKHILINAQHKEGSSFFNYKKQHSIVLLALVDANYNFKYINVGINGRISDGGVYRESDLYRVVEQNILNFPEDRPLPSRTKPVPFVIAADAAFPLSVHIMKPYPFENMTREQRIFNYRLSRVRRVVENAFGILANRFRVLLNINPLVPERVKIVTQACCALHNFLRHELKVGYTGIEPETEIDRRFTFLYGISAQAGNRPKNVAIETREEFKQYVNGVGSVPWQNEIF